MKSICVFCGSSSGANPLYLQAAKTLGETLAQANLKLIYGGASVGLMGAVADAALAAGGTVTGVIPHAKQEHVDMVMVEREPTVLLQRFAAYAPVVQAKWVT